MSERVTSQAIEERARIVSLALPRELRVVREGRYGYQALDLYDGDACLRTLSTGLTRREAYEYLGAMIETLDLVGRVEEETLS